MNINEIQNGFIEGFKLAIAKMMEQAKKDDREIAVYRDGKVVHIKARDLK